MNLSVVNLHILEGYWSTPTLYRNSIDPSVRNIKINIFKPSYSLYRSILMVIKVRITWAYVGNLFKL